LKEEKNKLEYAMYEMLKTGIFWCYNNIVIYYHNTLFPYLIACHVIKMHWSV
jgi:hypothetical protein